MDKFKLSLFSTAAFLFLVCLFVGGEVFQSNTVSLSSQYTSAEIKIDKGYTTQTLIQNINNATKKSGIVVFVQNNRAISTLKSEVTIYSTGENCVESIKSATGISEKTYKSMFSGETIVSFKDFSQLPVDDYLYSTIGLELYIDGSDADITSFLKQLEEDGIETEKPVKGSTEKADDNIVLVAWAACFIVLLFLSIYNMLLCRKEDCIMLAFGTSRSMRFLKKVLTDIVVYTALFFVTWLSFYCYSSISYLTKEAIVMLVAFLIVNTLMYTSLYFVNIKKNMSNTVSTRRCLIASMVIKGFITVGTIAAISFCAMNMGDFFSYHSQRHFFEEHKDYSYLNLWLDDSDERAYARTPMDDLYRELYRTQFDNGALQSIMLYEKAYSEIGINNSLVIVNKNAYELLEKCLKDTELSKNSFEDKVYLIVPDKLKNNSDFIDSTDSLIEQIFGSGYTDGYVTVSTKNNYEILVMSSTFDYGSDYVESPVIIFDNRDYGKEESVYGKTHYEVDVDYDNGYAVSFTDNIYGSYTKLCDKVMYKISDDEIQQFKTKYDIKDSELIISNCFEEYEFNYMLKKRLVIMNAVIMLMVLMINAILTYRILRMNYSINAIELAVKKTLGYSIFSKHFMMFFINFTVSVFAAAISAYIGSIIFGYTLATVLISACTLLLVILIDTAFSTIMSRHFEKANIQKILKGGAL